MKGRTVISNFFLIIAAVLFVIFLLVFFGFGRGVFEKAGDFVLDAMFGSYSINIKSEEQFADFMQCMILSNTLNFNDEKQRGAFEILRFKELDGTSLEGCRINRKIKKATVYFENDVVIGSGKLADKKIGVIADFEFNYYQARDFRKLLQERRVLLYISEDKKCQTIKVPEITEAVSFLLNVVDFLNDRANAFFALFGITRGFLIDLEKVFPQTYTNDAILQMIDQQKLENGETEFECRTSEGDKKFKTASFKMSKGSKAKIKVIDVIIKDMGDEGRRSAVIMNMEKD
jgi:hypothetical protein